MTPDCTLFVRSYSKDLPWFHELMRSLDRWAEFGPPRGWKELVVHVDPQDVAAFKREVGSRGRVVSSEPWCDSGYINQQIVKIHADLWCRSSYVTHCDSDCVACDTFIPERYFEGPLPDRLMTSYASLGNTVGWQKTVEQILGEPVEFEFMRAQRCTDPIEIYGALRTFIAQKHGTNDVGHWLCRWPALSEHNLIGAFAYKVARDRYHWRDTAKSSLPYHPLIQFPSYLGINAEARLRIENALA